MKNNMTDSIYIYQELQSLRKEIAELKQQVDKALPKKAPKPKEEIKKTIKKRVLTVKVINCYSASYWYSDRIGETFKVTSHDTEDYIVEGKKNCYLLKSDCKIIKPKKK